MAQIITNQASIAYKYNNQSAVAVSNIASAVLNETLGVEKVSLESVYSLGDEITYVITITNSGNTALTGVSVSDDLGTYAVGGATATPLVYTGPAIVFVDGVYTGNITPTVEADGVTFNLISLSVGSVTQIIYKATVNNFAPLNTGSQITNTVTVTGAGINAPVSDSNTIIVGEYADVTITKSMTPSDIVDGDVLTYTFVINNYGNTEATDIVLTDSFDPAPDNITVQVNGVVIPATDYEYVNGVLTLPTAPGTTELGLPPATITQDLATGEVTIVPSSLTVTVTGTI